MCQRDKSNRAPLGPFTVVAVFLFAWMPASQIHADGATTRFSASDFPLAKIPPLPPSNLKPADIGKLFPAFKHEPFETAGYNTLALPFRYNDMTGGGDS